MTDTANAPERIKAWMQPYFSEIGSWSTTRYPEVTIEYVLATHCDELVAAAEARAVEAQAELIEARRRRDEWKAKAEGYDEVRMALREKVGTPWPPHLSRVMWAGIAADEKKRADDAEAKIARLTEALAKYKDDLCEGFCMDRPWEHADDDTIRECSGCLARAALQENAHG